jgi:predicted exporter
LTPEQREKMASVANNTRELRMLKAVEKVGVELSGINYSLAMLSQHLLGDVWQECADKIAEMVTVPPAVEIREKKD